MNNIYISNNLVNKVTKSMFSVLNTFELITNLLKTPLKNKLEV